MSKSVSRELQTQVDPELLRGIPLDLCLSGWARHFRPPDPGMFKVDHSVYHLSKQTEHFDEFLSHDWETSRWYKFCAMLVIYNSRAAFLSSLVASVSVGSLRAMQVLPNELWTQLATLTVFPLVLCFWQRIRRLIAKPKVVFLDKLCIAHDEELKQKGIFGLAGFLDHSRQLTIFWSYRYFSRLWYLCEVARCFFSLLHSKSPPRTSTHRPDRWCLKFKKNYQQPDSLPTNVWKMCRQVYLWGRDISESEAEAHFGDPGETCCDMDRNGNNLAMEDEWNLKLWFQTKIWIQSDNSCRRVQHTYLLFVIFCHRQSYNFDETTKRTKVILCLFSAAEIWVMAGYYLSAYMVLGDKDTDFGQLVTFLTLFTIFYIPTLALVFFIGISMMVSAVRAITVILKQVNCCPVTGNSCVWTEYLKDVFW